MPLAGVLRKKCQRIDGSITLCHDYAHFSRRYKQVIGQTPDQTRSVVWVGGK